MRGETTVALRTDAAWLFSRSNTALDCFWTLPDSFTLKGGNVFLCPGFVVLPIMTQETMFRPQAQRGVCGQWLSGELKSAWGPLC